MPSPRSNTTNGEVLEHTSSTPLWHNRNYMLPFLSDAISYAVSVLSLLFIKSDFQKALSLWTGHHCLVVVICSDIAAVRISS
jgi:hypothetical protein